MEILLGVYLLWFWSFVASAIVTGVGVEHWYYGEDVPELSKRLGLWINTLAWPFQILTFPLLFSALSSTRLDQLGLTTRRFGRNILAGIAGMLALTPPVFGVYWLVRYLYAEAGEHGVEQHALEIIAGQRLFPAEWVMLIFMAMIAAPFLEELTFRGVLQSWLGTRRWGGHLAMLGALTFAVVSRRKDLLAAWPEGIRSLAMAAMPALFVLGLLPIYLLVCWRSRTPLGPAIFGTSLLFACVHTEVWPTPVPLFVLALGLGILAQRTRSLVGPIVLHSLFNGVSCVQLLMGW
ncbi:MAG TPA: CPBP family intramembrane glutamic endopeptidase [Gemmataceae bacterium]|jgi:membrane protease YdiL (CAAX protease family)